MLARPVAHKGVFPLVGFSKGLLKEICFRRFFVNLNQILHCDVAEEDVAEDLVCTQQSYLWMRTRLWKSLARRTLCYITIIFSRIGHRAFPKKA
jgi:hypothetical protein